MIRHSRCISAVLLGLTLALTSTACAPVKTASSGTVGSNDSVPLAKRVDSIAKTVPAEVREKGQLDVVMTVGMAPLNAPDSSTGEMEGFNPELARQLASVLGLDITISGASLDQILPGMQAGRYDVTLSNMDISEERLKVLDFVEYYFSATGLGGLSDSKEKLDVDNLCGKAIGVSNGSFQMTEVLPGLSDDCQSADKAPIDIEAFPDQQKAALALLSQRVDGTSMDGPVLLYASTQEPRIEQVARMTSGSNVGIGVGKDTDMTEPVADALQHLMDSGEYDRLLKKFGMESVALSTAKVHKS